MDFSIVTPSYRNSAWLKLCVASIADQQGVTHEHIVQDAGSDDGTLDWLPGDPRVRAFVEKDNGMYDAVNRGLRRAQGELLAYLNSDEQYLPGALAAVKEFFDGHPNVEMVFADMVVVDGNGEFLAYRKSVLPFSQHVRTCQLATPTCATFFRRSLLDQRGLFFDTRWRAVGDAVRMLDVLRQNVRMAVLRRYAAAFTDTGQNLSFTPDGLREKQRLAATAPPWTRALKPVWAACHRTRKWQQGCYQQAPFEYEIYTLNCLDRRTTFKVSRPTWRLRSA